MERTDHSNIDALLQRILTEPSHAADLLTGTAEQLEDDPALTITMGLFTAAANEASAQILEEMPREVARDAVDIAYRALPPMHPGQTCGQYAAALRDAAWGL